MGNINNMSPLMMFIVYGVLIMFISIVLIIRAVRRKSKLKKVHVTLSVLTCVIFITLFSLSAKDVIGIMHIAQDKGATQSQAMTTKISDLIHINSKSFNVNSGITKAHSGDLILITKYGCKDCQAIYVDAKNYIKTHDIKQFYIIDCDSSLASSFENDYDINDFPKLVYVRYNPIGNVKINQVAPYRQNNISGKTEFDENAFNDMLQRQLNKE